MLDRAALLAQMQHNSDLLFKKPAQHTQEVERIWHQLSNDTIFLERVSVWQGQWSVPLWSGNVSQTHLVTQPFDQTYSIGSIDGSQIYPDRHEGANCFLINIGQVIFNYSDQRSHFSGSSTPFLFTPQASEVEPTSDWVNAKRQELEFEAALALAQGEERIILFDGSLIFWHLQGKTDQESKKFIERYIALLMQFYEHKCMIAGYISLPHGRELVNIVRLWLSVREPLFLQKQPPLLMHLLDLHIVRFLLPSGYRTILFRSRSAMTEEYPAAVQPYFFYLNNGYEIVRVEIPAWIAQNGILIERLGSLIMDQSQKGKGYPLAIAEAHEQAVVKGADRDFFYQALSRMSIQEKCFFVPSYKIIRKRYAGF